LNEPPKRRKKTAAVLTDREHLNQAKMRPQKSTGLGKRFLGLFPELREQRAMKMAVLYVKSVSITEIGRKQTG
jgi:hypothetical protein